MKKRENFIMRVYGNNNSGGCVWVMGKILLFQELVIDSLTGVRAWILVCFGANHARYHHLYTFHSLLPTAFTMPHEGHHAVSCKRLSACIPLVIRSADRSTSWQMQNNQFRHRMARRGIGYKHGQIRSTGSEDFAIGLPSKR